MPTTIKFHAHHFSEDTKRMGIILYIALMTWIVVLMTFSERGMMCSMIGQ